MRGISQIVVAVLLAGTAIVAGSMLSYIVTDILTMHRPSSNIIARVGDVNAELSNVSSSGYTFVVTTKLVNLGTEPVLVQNGSVVVLIKGTAGRSKIMRCNITTPVTIGPGEIKDVVGQCFVSRSDVQNLFGSSYVAADVIKSSMTFLYLQVYVVYGGTQPSVPSWPGGRFDLFPL